VVHIGKLKDVRMGLIKTVEQGKKPSFSSYYQVLIGSKTFPVSKSTATKLSAWGIGTTIKVTQKDGDITFELVPPSGQ
jgi:hypothetical protein